MSFGVKIQCNECGHEFYVPLSKIWATELYTSGGSGEKEAEILAVVDPQCPNCDGR